MRLIHLTIGEKQDGARATVRINPQHVAMVIDAPGGSRVTLVTGRVVLVAETPERIDDLIREATG